MSTNSVPRPDGPPCVQFTQFQFCSWSSRCGATCASRPILWTGKSATSRSAASLPRMTRRCTAVTGPFWIRQVPHRLYYAGQRVRLTQPFTTFFWPAAYSSMFIPHGRSGTDWTSTRNCKSSSLLKDYSWHLAGDTTVQNMCFIETGYKVTAYKVNSDIKWSFNSPNFPLMTKFWSFIIIKLIRI